MTGFFEKVITLLEGLLYGASERATASQMVEFDAVELDAKKQRTPQFGPLIEEISPKGQGRFEVQGDLATIDQFDVVLEVKSPLAARRKCALDGERGLFWLIFGKQQARCNAEIQVGLCVEIAALFSFAQDHRKSALKFAK